ncbi:Signal transducer and activator of transcription 5B [Exaiptasia diaphana]|nr:Signal transducer and activator of transcription 5B [Exaiptasia diaphana]
MEVDNFSVWMENASCQMDEMLRAFDEQLFLTDDHKRTLSTIKDIIADQINNWNVQKLRAQVGWPVPPDLDVLQPLCEKISLLLLKQMQQMKQYWEVELSEYFKGMYNEAKRTFAAFIKSLFHGKCAVRDFIHELFASYNKRARNEQSFKEDKDNVNVLRVMYDKMSSPVSCCSSMCKQGCSGKGLVAEQKSCFLFRTQVTFDGQPYPLETISTPFVVVSKPDYQREAVEATVFWDSAFGEKERKPFVVPENVPLDTFLVALNYRWKMSNDIELKDKHLHHLARKLIPECDSKPPWTRFDLEKNTLSQKIRVDPEFKFLYDPHHSLPKEEVFIQPREARKTHPGYPKKKKKLVENHENLQFSPLSEDSGFSPMEFESSDNLSIASSNRSQEQSPIAGLSQVSETLFGESPFDEDPLLSQCNVQCMLDNKLNRENVQWSAMLLQ